MSGYIHLRSDSQFVYQRHLYRSDKPTHISIYLSPTQGTVSRILQLIVRNHDCCFIRRKALLMGKNCSFVPMGMPRSLVVDVLAASFSIQHSQLSRRNPTPEKDIGGRECIQLLLDAVDAWDAFVKHGLAADALRAVVSITRMICVGAQERGIPKPPRTLNPCSKHTVSSNMRR